MLTCCLPTMSNGGDKMNWFRTFVALMFWITITSVTCFAGMLIFEMENGAPASYGLVFIVMVCWAVTLAVGVWVFKKKEQVVPKYHRR